jgi:hypothetical protein
MHLTDLYLSLATLGTHPPYLTRYTWNPPTTNPSGQVCNHLGAPCRRRYTIHSSRILLSHTHTLSHTLISYTRLIHSSHTLVSYTLSHTPLSYTRLVHSPHTLTLLIHSPHTLFLIHSSHTLSLYTLFIHSSPTLARIPASRRRSTL